MWLVQGIRARDAVGFVVAKGTSLKLLLKDALSTLL